VRRLALTTGLGSLAFASNAASLTLGSSSTNEFEHQFTGFSALMHLSGGRPLCSVKLLAQLLFQAIKQIILLLTHPHLRPRQKSACRLRAH
jgi:hypothetical protein